MKVKEIIIGNKCICKYNIIIIGLTFVFSTTQTKLKDKINYLTKHFN